MIDLHCHILSGVDDGPSSIKDSIEMARVAVSEGINTIVATPHYSHPSFQKNEAPLVHQKVTDLNEELIRHNIPLEILPGHELRIHGDLIEELQDGTALSLANLGTYLFIEFPSNHVPSYATTLFYQLQVEGYQPVIVHPERNSKLIESPNILYEFVKSGILTQVTSSSITGHFGKKIQKFSKQLIEHQLTHFVSSDAHNVNSRSFRMKSAYSIIEEEFGYEQTNILKGNSEQVINNEAVIIEEAIPFKRKKLLGIF
ncbi:tyrosine-protein phosphatase [Alkalihalobacillus trypoxylicola]|uniref:Tyrosine-protein phosphatase n=1 Tax=Alkalihalobacillus trypoxylicola TaxID=519424 RepID=A0A162DQV9_9BACI|nr:CpsB/CapC family capsule biosynthesis tyrosine phosphatase [Alkalihalobacillus trypoxylicola]KYG30600.1 tyrosine protein phosphatase [Alkalihalobacillus trypoxylicola]